MFSSIFLETMCILNGYNYNIETDDMIQLYYNHIEPYKKEADS